MGSTSGMKATRERHLDQSTQPLSNFAVELTSQEPSPNGNSVSLEAEMMRSTKVRHDHDLALAVYKTSLDILRAASGRGR